MALNLVLVLSDLCYSVNDELCILMPFGCMSKNQYIVLSKKEKNLKMGKITKNWKFYFGMGSSAEILPIYYIEVG